MALGFVRVDVVVEKSRRRGCSEEAYTSMKAQRAPSERSSHPACGDDLVGGGEQTPESELAGDLAGNSSTTMTTKRIM